MAFLVEGYTADRVSDLLQSMATSELDIALTMNKIETSPPPTDYANLLRNAEVCFYIEMSSMTRETEQAFGVIKEETIGEYTKKYENGMPMFFFAQGGSNAFLELLPHETWRMRAYKYSRKYLRIHYTKTTGYIRSSSKVKQYEFVRGD